jgi:hypothetical protein
MRTMLTPGTQYLKLKRDELLSSFAFKFNMRRYITEDGKMISRQCISGRASHSSTFQLNLSRSGHTSLCPPV